MTNFPFKLTKSKNRETLLKHLARDAYRYGAFTRSSGEKSNHYVNCKPVSLKGSCLLLLSQALLAFVEDDAVAVAGLTLGADPLVSGVIIAAAQASRTLDGIIVRKEPKGHGTEASLEGPLPQSGDVITVLEDVVTTGQSSLKAVNQLRNCGYCVNRVVTIVDREEGGEKTMNSAGLELFSLYQLNEIAKKAKEISND